MLGTLKILIASTPCSGINRGGMTPGDQEISNHFSGFPSGYLHWAKIFKPMIFIILSRVVPFGRITYPTSEAPNYSGYFKFLISQGADIEYRDPNSRKTALLVAAEGDDDISLNWMQELLWLDADYSAVDYKGRGPLHLTLEPCRWEYLLDVGPTAIRCMKDKLVRLLQAGCSIHAVDNYGRTPTDVARYWGRTRTWEAALQEVGKLECARSECQCEVTVSLPRLSEKGSRLIRKVVTDTQLTYAEDLYFPILQYDYVDTRS